jgi:two-component system, cell cycle response regulator CtrA
MSDWQARAQQLQIELEEAKARIRSLEAELGVSTPVPLSFGLTGAQTCVMGIILKRPLATKNALMTGLYHARSAEAEVPAEKIVDVIVCHVRRKVAPFGIEIETIWGQGWRMSDDHKQRVHDLVHQERAATA